MLVGPPASEAYSCQEKGSTTLLDNGVARVYRLKGGGDAYTGRFAACAFSAGYPILLEAPQDDYAYPPPAIALSKTVIGYALDVCDDTVSFGYCHTRVLAEDLAEIGYPTYGRIRFAPAAPPGGTAKRARVGSLVVRRIAGTAALAWITCPQRGDKSGDFENYGTPKPNCLRAGQDDDTVLRLESNKDDPEALASGRDIDPRSLRRKGDKIMWRQGDRWRRAALR